MVSHHRTQTELRLLLYKPGALRIASVMEKEKERALKEDIVRASKSVREKFRALKRSEAEQESKVKKRFEPLLEPLNKIIELTKEKKEHVTMPKFVSPPLSQKPKGIETEKGGVKRKRSVMRDPVPTIEDSDEETEDESGEEDVFSDSDVYESPADDRARIAFQEYLKQFGPITQEYVTKSLTEPGVKLDRTFGVRPNFQNDTWWIGNKEVVFDKQDNIHIGETMIPGTHGIFELMFKKLPNPALINARDKEKYKRILELTNAHKQGYNPEAQIASSHGIKYNSIIKQLFPRTTGKGLLPVTDNKIDYVHWNDPNELIERLALLIASEKAGNGGHKAEIASIEEELREANYIE